MQLKASARLPTSCLTEKHNVALLQEVEKSLSFEMSKNLVKLFEKVSMLGSIIFNP